MRSLDFFPEHLNHAVVDLFDRHGPDILFWGSLGLMTLLYLQPLWLGHLLPTTDFGGHLAMADVWARLDDVEVYQRAFRRQSGVMPNTVAARFVGWLHPAVSTLTAMRLFVSLALVGTIGALLAVLRTFGRSRWIIFGAFPLLWNGSFYWGMVNYFAVFPLFFAGVALARKTGETAHWWWGVALTITATISFFVHGIGGPLTIIAATLILALSLRHLRSVWWFGSLVPGTALWFYWRRTTSAADIPDKGIVETFQNAAGWFSPDTTFDKIIEFATDATVASYDTAVFAMLIGVWLIWMGTASTDHESAPRLTETDSNSVLHTLQRALRSHSLLILTIVLGALCFLLPSYIRMTNISTRVIPLFLFSALCLPRFNPRDPIAVVGIVAAIAVSLSFGLFMKQKVRTFDEQELQPLMRVINKLPDQQRVECLNVHGNQNPVFHGRPLDLNCPALIYVHTSGIGGFGFPKTGFNPVTFTEWGSYPTLRRSWYSDLGKLQWWDYLVVRGPHDTPPPRLTRRVAHSSTAGETPDKSTAAPDDTADKSPRRTSWTLYRVHDFQDSYSLSHQRGGTGGNPFVWPCPNKQAIRQVSGTINHTQTIQTLRGACGKLEFDEPDPRISFDDFSALDQHPPVELTMNNSGANSPPIGHRDGAPSEFTARCPADQFMVGMTGHAGKFVDQLNILCAPVTLTSDADDKPRFEWHDATQISGGGGSGGSPFRITCPNDQIVTGLTGRHGLRIDAAGITCSTADITLSNPSRP